MMKLPEHICDEDNGLTYTLVGDYYLPDLTLPEAPESIGKWGRMYREYLWAHQKILLDDLVLSGELHSHLAKMNTQATARYNCLIEQMKDREGITGALKETDQMAWVGAMNNIRNRAEEIVLRELIYEVVT